MPRPTARLRLNQLEDRTTPAAVYYANDAWLGLAPGTAIPDADPITPGDQPAVYGQTAFYSLTEALAASAASPFGGQVY
jgi:hypothetical protein